MAEPEHAGRVVVITGGSAGVGRAIARLRRVTEVTYLGCVHGTLAVLHRMLPRDEGVIVQVGSPLAYRAIPLQATYCVAKHAARAFSGSLRVELLQRYGEHRG